MSNIPTNPPSPKPNGLPTNINAAAPQQRGLPIKQEKSLESVISNPLLPRKKENDDQFFDKMFYNSEEEERLKEMNEKGDTFKYGDKYSETEAKIKARREELRQQYPSGGLAAFQFITYDIIAGAPTDYFTRFEDYVQETTAQVQTALSDKGLSDHVGKASANPFDEKLQDEAFRKIQTITAEKLEHSPYKGTEKQILIYMIASDILGLSRLEPLWRDRSIDEIICNGPFDIQVETRGKLHRVPACQFRNAAHLEGLLERIFSSIGKTLSVATPYLDGRLYDQSRIAATHRRISPEGPNVAIRRHPEKWWTAMDLIKFGSATEELFTDVGNWIYKGCSYIVIGGTSSGKTSLLNATSGFFNPEERILTLEDNLELKMHPNKLVGAPMEVVPPNPNKAGDRGVTMRTLVTACLRMRPNGIVIGEVRDGAMYDLCQALNTGHWGASTVHANSPEEGIYRMQSLATQSELVSADGALPLIASAFDFVIMQQHFPQDGSRKITCVAEIDPFPTINDQGRYELGINRIWEFQPDDYDETDLDAKVTGEWVKVGEMSAARRKRRFLDMTRDLSWDELTEVAKIPEEFMNKKH